MPLIDPVTMSGTAPPVITLKQSSPIELLPTSLAAVFTNIHPALLFSVFCFRFPALVEDPVPTLLINLIPVAIIQILYAVICLPAVGSNTKPVKKAKAGAPKKPAVGSAILTGIIASILSLVSIPALAAVQVLCGAPVTTHIPHTLLSSAHLALLAVFPLIFVHGNDRKKWREIVSVYSPIDEVFGGTMGCFLGAWLGAVPIPLDWDREWQKWPVTIVTGAYAGYMVGKFVGGWLLKGKRINLS